MGKDDSSLKRYATSYLFAELLVKPFLQLLLHREGVTSGVSKTAFGKVHQYLFKPAFPSPTIASISYAAKIWPRHEGDQPVGCEKQVIRWQLWGIVVQPVPVVEPFQRVRENVVRRKLTAPSTAVVSTDTDENKATNQCHPRYQSCLNRRRLTFLKCRLRLAGEEESPEQHAHSAKRCDLANPLAGFYEIFVCVYEQVLTLESLEGKNDVMPAKCK